MATIQIELPDELVQQAQQAGILSRGQIEMLLRERLKTQRIDTLFSAMDKMANLEGVAYMSPEEVAQELAAMRFEKRTEASR